MLSVNFLFAGNKLLPHTSMDVRGDIDRFVRNYFYNLEPWTNIDFLCVIITVITARKRNLGQRNVFTPVCHSVHREEMYPSMQWAGSVYSRMQWGRGCVWPEVWTRGVWSGVHLHYGQQAGGMHPTRMLSCVLRIMFLQQQYDSGYCTICPLMTQEWALHASWQGFHSTYTVHSMLRAPSISLVSIVPVAA